MYITIFQAFKSKTQRVIHIKMCAQDYGLTSEQLLQASRLLEKQYEEWNKLGLPTAVQLHTSGQKVYSYLVLFQTNTYFYCIFKYIHPFTKCCNINGYHPKDSTQLTNKTLINYAFTATGNKVSRFCICSYKKY